jgi:hypothetical protein
MALQYGINLYNYNHRNLRARRSLTDMWRAKLIFQNKPSISSLSRSEDEGIGEQISASYRLDDSIVSHIRQKVLDASQFSTILRSGNDLMSQQDVDSDQTEGLSWKIPV